MLIFNLVQLLCFYVLLDIFKVKVSAGAKVGAKVRVFGVAKVGVNADIETSHLAQIH
jgi:hypothetical protein